MSQAGALPSMNSEARDRRIRQLYSELARYRLMLERLPRESAGTAEEHSINARLDAIADELEQLIDQSLLERYGPHDHQPILQPVQQPVQQPILQPVQQPVQQPILQPVQQPVQGRAAAGQGLGDRRRSRPPPLALREQENEGNRRRNRSPTLDLWAQENEGARRRNRSPPSDLQEQEIAFMASMHAVDRLSVQSEDEQLKALEVLSTKSEDMVKYKYSCESVLVPEGEDNELVDKLLKYLNRLLSSEEGEGEDLTEKITTNAYVEGEEEPRKMVIYENLSYDTVVGLRHEVLAGVSDMDGVQVLYNPKEKNALESLLNALNEELDRNVVIKPLRVKFEGEGEVGSDAGGLTKTLLTDLANEIKVKHCESMFEDSIVCGFIKRAGKFLVRENNKSKRKMQLGVFASKSGLVEHVGPSTKKLILNKKVRDELKQGLFKYHVNKSAKRVMKSANATLQSQKLCKREQQLQKINNKSVKASDITALSKELALLEISPLKDDNRHKVRIDRERRILLEKLSKLEKSFKSTNKLRVSELTKSYNNLYGNNNRLRVLTVGDDIRESIRKRALNCDPMRLNLNGICISKARLNDVKRGIALALFRHMFIDNIKDSQLLQFGILRLPVLYMFILSSMMSEKSEMGLSLYDLMRKRVVDLTREEQIILLHVYNMALRLDCQSEGQREKYAISDMQLMAYCEEGEEDEYKEDRLGRLERNQEQYFASENNKSDVLDIFELIHGMFVRFVPINSPIHRANACVVGMLKLFVPNPNIKAVDILNRIRSSDGVTLENHISRLENHDVLHITGSLLIELANEANTEEKLNILRNITGSASLPSVIKLVIVHHAPPGSLALMYHTCFNQLDINVNIAEGMLYKWRALSEEERRRKYKDYLRIIFLKEMMGMGAI